jgi:hypothetical protein
MLAAPALDDAGTVTGVVVAGTGTVWKVIAGSAVAGVGTAPMTAGVSTAPLACANAWVLVQKYARRLLATLTRRLVPHLSKTLTFNAL